jgi:hypothetical protein
VAKPLGHDLDWHAGGDAERRGAMTLIVQLDHPQRGETICYRYRVFGDDR